MPTPCLFRASQPWESVTRGPSARPPNVPCRASMWSQQAPFPMGASSEAVLMPFFYHCLTQSSEEPVGRRRPRAIHSAPLCPLLGEGSVPRDTDHYLTELDDTRPGGIILLHVGTRTQRPGNTKRTAQTQEHKLATEVAGTDPTCLAHGLPTGRGCRRQTQRLGRRRAAGGTWGVWQGCRQIV